MNFLRQWARARLTSNFTAVNQFHSSAVLSGGLSRKEILSTAVKKDDGAQGESSIDIDSLVSRYEHFYTSIDLIFMQSILSFPSFISKATRKRPSLTYFRTKIHQNNFSMERHSKNCTSFIFVARKITQL